MNFKLNIIPNLMVIVGVALAIFSPYIVTKTCVTLGTISLFSGYLIALMSDLLYKSPSNK